MQVADQLKAILIAKYGKRGYQTRFFEDKGIPQSRTSEALNAGRDGLVSQLVAIADALDCDVLIVPRDR